MTPPLSIAELARVQAQSPQPFAKRDALNGTCQTTLAESARFEGVGVHSGEIVRVALHPSQADSGIVFVRSDAPCADKGRILARYDHVCDVALSTKLGNEYGFEVGTVEHLLAAIAGAQIDNLLIEIDGAEVPIMDGSSNFFVDLIRDCGVQELAAPRRIMVIKKPVRVEHNGSVCELVPDNVSAFEAEIDFEAGAIGRQSLAMTLCNGGFNEELADARTFCLVEHLDAMHAQGLGRGGSLDNAIVVDGDKVLNSDGLRKPDEFIRHKLLDAVGDMYLAGAQIIGRYRGYRPGHALHNLLLKALFDDPDAFDIVTLDMSESVIAAE